MEGNLVIVESPAKAGTIQRFLGSDYTVKSSFGHIRDLQEKDLSIDIEHGFKPQYVISPDKVKVVSELKKLAGKASTVWLASDEDREGEAISWHLMEVLGLDPAKTKRIAFHEITKTAIQNAIENPRQIDMNLVDAQQARRVLDRLVGFELSPVLWRKVQRGLSAGRVQSVALRLVVEREKEIIAYQSNPSYKVEAVFRKQGSQAGIKAVLDTRFDTIGQARKFLEDCIGATFSVEGVESKEGTRFPAPPFTTSTLQQEASRVLHMPVSTTMRVAQSLYEKGLITYMRTDSTNLSTLALGAARQYITDNFGAGYSHSRQYKTNTKGAQEAHEAIRPTYIANPTVSGTPQEQKLYQLIWKRTVASQMTDAQVLNTTVRIASDRRDERFVIQASQVLFDGFLKLYMESSDEEDEEQALSQAPGLTPGETLAVKSIAADCKFPPAPPRYSEATLVKALEKLGIGRPSTYAPTITTLTTARGYLVRGDKEGRKVTVQNLLLKGDAITSADKVESVGAERGKLLPQEIGMLVSDYLTANFPDIMDYDFTANVEEQFDSIAEGKMRWNKVIEDFYGPFHKGVRNAIEAKEYAHVERVIGTAPDGEQVVARLGQYGPYVQKGDPEKRVFASLSKGQLIENITLEEALALFALPRTVGEYEGIPVVALKGRYGPYLKYGDKNLPMPKGANPLTISLDKCVEVIRGAEQAPALNAVIARWEQSDISILSGRYGPYIKHADANYRIPKGTDAASLTEQQCREIISQGAPAGKGKSRYARRKK